MDKPAFKKVPVIPCGVALIRRGREFLITQRNAADTFGSYWEFPGGKKDRGETFKECIIREIKEELGIEITVGRCFMDLRRSVNGKVIWLNFYLCAHRFGDPRPLESQKFLWVDVAHLRDFNFPPANELVIAKLMRLVEHNPC